LTRALRRFLIPALALLALALIPAHALADGDPGSDVLLDQNLFSSVLSDSQQVQLGDLLNATSAVGDPIRVAVIANQSDLGTVTTLWDQPQRYSEYLGYELSLTYAGRLLIVMPNGFGVYWHADPAAAATLARSLSSVHIAGGTPADLKAATEAAVYKVEAAAGVDKSTLAQHLSGTGVAQSNTATGGASTQSGPSNTTSNATSGTGHKAPGVVAVIVVLVLLSLYMAWRRGWRPPKIRPRLRERRRAGGEGASKRLGIKPIALLPTVLLAIVIAALVINHSGTGGTGNALDSNPNLDPGSQISPIRTAPDFTLTDETDNRVSLSQYRGKVVVLAFIDAECQTICPLTSQELLDAKRSLGAAGKDVQLLGVNANWRSTQIDDVANYTDQHGLAGQWHFLTGTPSQLERIWTAYGVDEQALVSTDSTAIDHVAAVDLINPKGQWTTAFTTAPSYASINQQGQLLAQAISKLLPSHPKVNAHYSYTTVPGIPPTQTTKLPRVGGGTVTLGPGKPHLYLFFATWDTLAQIGPELSELNAYAKSAKAKGLPPLTAVDESTVEPSSQALPEFLKHDLPQPLTYPVAIDTTGRVADGYQVEGEPWFVLTSPTGTSIPWYQEVYSSGWPTLKQLDADIKAGLSTAPTPAKNAAAVRHDLSGSPAPLATLHAQSSKLLPGGADALYKRIHELHGYPIVLNIWQSVCVPCQAEFGLFANASAEFGSKVAFIGADNDDTTQLGSSFLRSHHVSYPSYATQDQDLTVMLPGGLQGTPTTVYISPNGCVLDAHIGQYQSQGVLDQDIEDYALSGAKCNSLANSP